MDIKILYVEDDQGIQKQLAHFLSFFSKNILLASNGEEGLALFKEHQPQIVISDISMPKMDGIMMVSKIQEENKSVHIIFTTAYNESSYLLDALELQVDGYILKPVDLHKLEKKLQKIIEAETQKEELQTYKDNLEKKVEEAMHKSKLQEVMLFQQTKLAQTGELLNMIAHQWRQPLNVISATVMNLQMQQSLEVLNEEELDNALEIIDKQTQNLSTIINDFMNFNREKSVKHFFLHKAVNEAYKIIAPQFKTLEINVEINLNQDIEVLHNQQYIEHIVLNILTNARDAFEEREIKNRKISISTKEEEGYLVLSIEDNAGGIPDDIVDKIFDPYFTTKEQGKGTGIGLYMSKKMMQSIANDSLEVSIEDDKTTFFLKFCLA